MGDEGAWTDASSSCFKSPGMRPGLWKLWCPVSSPPAALGYLLVFVPLPLQDEHAVSLLLQAGANPALSNNDMGEESTPLHAAAAAGQAGILQALLDAWPAQHLSAAVNQAGDNGWTPLMLAARKGSANCVRLLLERGADAASKNVQGRTAADIAAVNRREAVVALLAEVGAGSTK